jgi:redox-sensitive bicupin YhaK (pirin superfamily)
VITLARAETRRHSVGGTQSSWRTFHRRGPSSPLAGGFGRLELLDEFRLSAGASIPDHARREGETITFVHEGALAYRNSLGHSAVLQAGEFQLRTVSDGLRSVEENASPADSVHFFRISLRRRSGSSRRKPSGASVRPTAGAACASSPRGMAERDPSACDRTP